MNNKAANLLRIALVVDNPKRDLPGMVLLAWELTRRGFSPILVPMNLQWWELAALAPDFVLFNYLRPNNSALVKQIQEAGIGTGVLDTEGGLEDFEKYGRTLADASRRSGLSLFTTWGEGLAKHVVQAGWFQKDQVVVTGVPRMDFYSEPWKKVCLYTSPELDKLAKPMVMINTNFPFANPKFRTKEQDGEMLVRDFGWDPEVVKAYQGRSAKLLETFLLMIPRLLKSFPQVLFVLRPHPFEKTETYENRIPPAPNFLVSNNGTIDSWLFRASAVIHRSCTTGFEAALAGVPSLSVRWVEPMEEVKYSEAVSIGCDTYEELELQLQKILHGKFEFPQAIKDYTAQISHALFSRMDGQSFHRVATALTERARLPDRPAVRQNCLDLLYRVTGQKSFNLYLRNRISKMLRLPLHAFSGHWRRIMKGDIPRWDLSGKRFSARDVNAILAAIDRVASEESLPGTPSKIHAVQSVEAKEYILPFPGRSVSVRKAD